jgi:hypothetical protein
MTYVDKIWDALARLNIPRHAVSSSGVNASYPAAEQAGAAPEEAAIVFASLLPEMYRSIANPFAINGWIRNGALRRDDPSVRKAIIDLGWGRFLR